MTEYMSVTGRINAGTTLIPWNSLGETSVLPARRYASGGTTYSPVSVSLCLSVTSRSSIETTERIELIFSTTASFHLSYTVIKENSGICKNKRTSLTSLWNSDPNSGLRKLLRHMDRRNLVST